MLNSNEGDETRLTLSEARMKTEDLIDQSKNYDSTVKRNQEEIQNNREELKQLESKIEIEQKRVAKLKLKRDQFEKEAQKVKQDNESNQKYTRTVMEGFLLKAVSKKSHSGLIKTYVWLEVASKGTPMLSWAPDQMSSSVERAIVKNVVSFSEKQAFKVELGFGRHLKAATMVFADHDQDIRKRWLSELETALTAWKSGHRQNNEKAITEGTLFAREITFLSVPLGFGVATATATESKEEIKVTSIQNKNLWSDHGLQVGMRLIACNGESLINVDYAKGMAIIKTAVKKISEKNPVTIRFQGCLDMLKEPANEEKRMEDLYPNAAVGTSLGDHPMVGKPVFAKYKDDEKFQKLCQELISDPKKLNEFLQRKDL